jgi:2-polyprenyl-3-methyl-5-hydroxy-6-metoxy-1,4-benzoquinol methylase
MPTAEEMRAYAEQHYREGVYAEYARARPLKVATFRRRLALLSRHLQGGRLLDLGAACGFMLEAALEAGFDPSGVEFSAPAIELAAPAIRPRIVRGDVNDLPPGQFDVLTAFDIIEHQLDPALALRRWAERLRPGGLLLLTTPDAGSLLGRLMGRHWPMLQPLQHTVLFSREAMARLVDEAGLDLLLVRSAEKVMTPAYLTGQLEPYFPRAAGALLRLGRTAPTLAGLALPFRIGEFLVMARRRPTAA